jgi:DNA topoisomerase-2
MSQTFPKIEGNYDYLLNIKTVQYTEESVASLLKEAKDANEDLERIMKTSHLTMWKMDIKNI